jgi:hypothetical protein
MDNSPAQADQIVELNVGGENMTTYRSTLCASQGSMLAAMFSGRWEEKLQKDKDGRYFLDHDPYCMRKIIDFLRSKKIEDPDNPMPLPTISPEKENELKRLAEYLGLVEMFSRNILPDSVNPDDIAVVAPFHGDKLVSIRSELGLTLRYTGSHQHCFLRSQNLIRVGQIWKIKIMQAVGWILLGVITTPNARIHSYLDTTCFAWACKGCLYQAGQFSHQDGWPGFSNDDIAVFRLEEHCLHMVLRRASDQQTTTWSMPRRGQGDAYLHVDVCDENTSIQLQPVTAEDSSLFST